VWTMRDRGPWTVRDRGPSGFGPDRPGPDRVQYSRREYCIVKVGRAVIFIYNIYNNYIINNKSDEIKILKI
jgi:hypothetical protein